MSSKDGLVRFLKRQISIEKEIVDSLDRAVGGIENPVVRGTLRRISLDSSKHAEMYSAALELLERVPLTLKEEQLEEQRLLLEERIRLEAMPGVKDEKVRLLLNVILSDERRYHELLRGIVQIIVRGETITEEEGWDFIWKSSLGIGLQEG